MIGLIKYFVMKVKLICSKIVVLQLYMKINISHDFLKYKSQCISAMNPKINLLRYQKFKNALGDLKNFGLDIIHLHKNKRNQILHYVLFCLHLTSFLELLV